MLKDKVRVIVVVLAESGEQARFEFPDEEEAKSFAFGRSGSFLVIDRRISAEGV